VSQSPELTVGGGSGKEEGGGTEGTSAEAVMADEEVPPVPFRAKDRRQERKVPRGLALLAESSPSAGEGAQDSPIRSLLQPRTRGPRSWVTGRP